MNSEVKRDNKNSSVKLYNREKVELTGVIKILNLNSEEFLLETTLGKVFVEGKDLEMNKIEQELGNLTITGIIDTITYNDKAKEEKKKESFFSKLFK